MGIYNSVCDFNKYKTFYAVAETRSFSGASEVLHISQPAISHAVKELEDNLNTKLDELIANFDNSFSSFKKVAFSFHKLQMMYKSNKLLL